MQPIPFQGHDFWIFKDLETFCFLAVRSGNGSADAHVEAVGKGLAIENLFKNKVLKCCLGLSSSLSGQI